ncbi:MAG: NUDIX hydrolase [Longimicrobiales bacterium]|nr:NUDIX hydrolase [Longimicrobiales bacterium]
MSRGDVVGGDPPGTGGVSHDDRISRRVVHDGRVVHLGVDRVRFPDGSTGELELVEHSGAAAVLPVVGDPDADDPEVLLIRQYRYAAGGYLYEVPAGTLDAGDESWEECARRELLEETGYEAGDLRRLTWIFTTPGFTDEIIHLFLATDLTEREASRDVDEFMEVVRMPLSRALAMVRDSKIVDAKSMITLFHAAHALGGPLGFPG